VPALSGLENDRIFVADPLDISSISVALQAALNRGRKDFSGFEGIEDSWDRYVAELLSQIEIYNADT